MTQLVGPVYVAHPYTAPSEQLRRFNVTLAAELATTANRMGAATISPLQESRGREEALGEEHWFAHGIVVLGVCRAIVLPRQSIVGGGCLDELVESRCLGIPKFFADRVISGIDSPFWRIETAFAEWIDSERAKLR